MISFKVAFRIICPIVLYVNRVCAPALQVSDGHTLTAIIRASDLGVFATPTIVQRTFSPNLGERITFQSQGPGAPHRFGTCLTVDFDKVGSKVTVKGRPMHLQSAKLSKELNQAVGAGCRKMSLSGLLHLPVLIAASRSNFGGAYNVLFTPFPRRSGDWMMARVVGSKVYLFPGK